MMAIQWGKNKDNYIAIYKKDRAFKVIRSKSRLFVCYRKFRMNINNPFNNQGD